MKRLLLPAILALLPGSALACKCETLSLAERYREAPIVFVGAAAAGFRPGKSGQTVELMVSRAVKGAASAGTTFTIDPLFGTDCAAYIMPGVPLLIFAYPREGRAPVASACSTRVAGPVATGEGVMPAPADVTEFLESVSR